MHSDLNGFLKYFFRSGAFVFNPASVPLYAASTAQGHAHGFTGLSAAIGAKGSA
jgi:hypothetical protein